MSAFERRTSLGVGIVLLVVFVWSLWRSLEVLSAESFSLTTIALLGAGLAMLLGGLAFVLAGLRERITIAGRTLEWWQFQHVGFVFLGCYMAISGLSQATLASVFSLSSLAAGIGFATFGLYRLRYGRPEETEPSMRQIAIVVVGTMGYVLLLALLMIASI